MFFSWWAVWLLPVEGRFYVEIVFTAQNTSFLFQCLILNIILEIAWNFMRLTFAIEPTFLWTFVKITASEQYRCDTAHCRKIWSLLKININVMISNQQPTMSLLSSKNAASGSNNIRRRKNLRWLHKYAVRLAALGQAANVHYGMYYRLYYTTYIHCEALGSVYSAGVFSRLAAQSGIAQRKIGKNTFYRAVALRCRF